MHPNLTRGLAVVVAVTAAALPLGAVAAHPLLDSYRSTAQAANPAFKDFSASTGKTFYNTQGATLACASCHTANPLAAGKHATTSKVIAPLSPLANPKRFTDAANVEKWFKRNCNDVLARACTAQEKGDFIAYVLSVK